MRRQPAPLASLLLVLAVLAAVPVHAGTISLSWDPVPDSDLAGYRVFYGTTAGTYTQQVNLGLVTSHTLAGLADCTPHYVAVKAVNTAGLVSTDYSNEVSGWARPTVAAVAPASATQGASVPLVVSGTNFMPGALVTFSNPGVTVNSVTVNSCTQLTVQVTVAAAATPGALNVEVTNPDQVYGVGAGVFSVVASDTTPPAITNVGHAEVTGTSARIGWVTDEVSDSRVSWRRQGLTTWQSTSTDPTFVTTHSVLLQGLEPSTAYEYTVHSSDAAGNAAASAARTFTTTSSPYRYLRFEAESGAVTAPVRTATGEGAFTGAFIELPVGAAAGGSTAPSGTSRFGFHVPYQGTWRIWVRLYGPNAASDRWLERVNGAGWASIEAPVNGAWVWVAARSYSLTQGLHTLDLGGRDPGARADRVLVTDDPNFVPTEVPSSDVTPPAAVTQFTATAASQRVSLSWRNPTTADFRRTVIRYRTDGQSPRSPADGFPVTEQLASPGSNGSFEHAGLTDGTTYRYAAFAIDAEGNAAAGALQQAVPSAPATAPPQVNNLVRTDTR